VFRYYNSATQLNQDADVVIPPNDETAQYAFRYLIAGGVAGAISRTCTAPLDRLKVHLITYVAESTGTSDSIVKRSPRTSLMQAIKMIYKSGGGIRAFFLGNGLNVAKIFPESAIKFWSFEKAKVALSKIEGIDEKNHISTVARFAAGGIAGIISQFAIYPVETLKIRIQSQPFISPTDKSVQKSVNSAIVSTAKQMYRSGGLMAFWPGLVCSTS
jgi:solute carrier family 25 phosphate transporter 23/24/25/41